MAKTVVDSAAVKKLREETGVSMHEAKRMLECRLMNDLLNERFWFLHLRTLLRYLINRGPDQYGR